MSNPYMDCRAGKHNKRYIYRLRATSPLDVLIHSPGYLSDRSKFLSNFGKNYYQGIPSKESKYEDYESIENQM